MFNSSLPNRGFFRKYARLPSSGHWLITPDAGLIPPDTGLITRDTGLVTPDGALITSYFLVFLYTLQVARFSTQLFLMRFLFTDENRIRSIVRSSFEDR